MKFNVHISLSDNRSITFTEQVVKHWAAGYNEDRTPKQCKTLDHAIKACTVQIDRKESMIFDDTVINMGNILSIRLVEIKEV